MKRFSKSKVNRFVTHRLNHNLDALAQKESEVRIAQFHQQARQDVLTLSKNLELLNACPQLVDIAGKALAVVQEGLCQKFLTVQKDNLSCSA